ncbi:peroxisomal acyl-coenzyme A oxidase 3 isoform X2 [Macrotis lagotis]|uniref:peroxisomal acyl-coenzyme A oxidase 3 isoform X2 n=1 Tax=Macrotis lagotis TaxID=92651 RepID=UPI003D69D264
MAPNSKRNDYNQSSQDALVPDLPKGPLCMYRAKSSFSWKELLLFLDGEDLIIFKKRLFSAFENDPLFAHHPGEELPIEKYRELNFLRCKRLFEYDFLSIQEMMKNPLKIFMLINCLGMYDWSLSAKYFLNTYVFASTIQNSGSQRHMDFIQKTLDMEIFGCFALTEVSHGSNTKAIRTTAQYDATTQEFIINSPDFEASKFWIGNMGKNATHAVVYAQLYTPGGQCHGLHSFVVQIRNPKTLLPMPGIMVGDIGKKLGQNGLDNGIISKMAPNSKINDYNQRSQDALLPDLPKGPLCLYREKSSFSWKELLLFLDGEDLIIFKKRLFSAFENDPLFAHHPGEELPIEKYRELNFLHCKRLFEYDFLNAHEMMKNPLKFFMLINCLGMYDWSLSVKYFLNTYVFATTIQNSGSQRHMDFIKKALDMEIFGCFAMTEVSHGSNIKAIRTTAQYDPTTQEFIINSPDFEASKFSIGNMGKNATHAVVYAQLYTPGGQCHGLHSFVVQIRNPKTLLPMPGIMVGDIGKKLGQNGLDNGFTMFHNVRIPRENLLNRTDDVTPEGVYTTSFKDARQRFGALLDSLCFARFGIIGMSMVNLKLAISIAIRFSATRRQFGPRDDEEIPVLEYQMQQWRLIPYLAAAYALEHFSKTLFSNMMQFQMGLLQNDKSIRQAELGREIHALTSAGKPLASWTAQQGAQECREACGGHGYLAMNRLGDIRNDNDPNCTYEGDNNVLLQQTSNYLLNYITDRHPDKIHIESPLESVNFLEDFKNILGQKFMISKAEDCMDSSVSLAAYKWLVCYLLRESYQKLNQERKSGSDNFEARNNCQVYYCHSLALVFIEHTVLQRYHDFTHQSSTPAPLQPVLKRLSALYGLWALSKHMAVLYQGGYFSGEQAGKMIKNAILELCTKPPLLKTCAVMSDKGDMARRYVWLIL